MYYNWRPIEGYGCPVIVVVGPRGVGKTFKVVLTKGIKSFLNKSTRFVYVVETQEMVKTLSQNKGEKFFASIFEYLEKNQSKTNKKILEALKGYSSDDTEITEGDVLNKIQGGTIKIAGQTAGYLISINDFANLKRNNFRDIGYIIIDEFIPETIDIRHLQQARKIVSLVQSIARLKDVKIYMLGNSIRLNDIVLVKLGLDNMQPGEMRVIKDKYGPLIVAHFVDRNEYKQFIEASDQSVAGRLASILGENKLEHNEFKDSVPPEMLIPDRPKRSHLLMCLHGATGSIRINVTQDYSDYYVLSDYGRNVKQRYCFDKKYSSPTIQYYKEWEDVLMQKYTSGHVLFESAGPYLIFKEIMKLNME